MGNLNMEWKLGCVVELLLIFLGEVMELWVYKRVSASQDKHAEVFNAEFPQCLQVTVK